jgi:hypothetical protein
MCDKNKDEFGDFEGFASSLKPKAEVTISEVTDCGGHLHGNVTGHPRFLDGKYIKTGTIVKRDGPIVETSNTIYTVVSTAKEEPQAELKEPSFAELANPTRILALKPTFDATVKELAERFAITTYQAADAVGTLLLAQAFEAATSASDQAILIGKASALLDEWLLEYRFDWATE